MDESCIDCGTCYTFAPATYEDAGEHSVVHRQPASDEDRRNAHLALIACPTASIGTDDTAAARAAAEGFPVPFHEEVFWCGYTSESSFGAWSWLVRREAGNVLVDSPRAAAPLLRGLEAVGGASLLFLTHRDDIADHAALRARLGCERVMHRDDGIGGMERYVEGSEPTSLADDLLAIPVPGHTRGSCALLYRNQYLFTGDHLWWEPSLGRLHASRNVNWWRWEEQVRSIEKLLDFDFEWVLPGHGAPWHAASPAAMKRMLHRVLRENR